ASASSCIGCGRILLGFQPVRYARHKPWHPRFKIIRQLRVHEFGPELRNRPSVWFEDEFGRQRSMPDRIKLMQSHSQIQTLPFLHGSLFHRSSDRIFEPMEEADAVEGSGLRSLVNKTARLWDQKKPKSSHREAENLLKNNDLIPSGGKEELARLLQDDYCMTDDILNRSYRFELLSVVSEPKIMKFAKQEIGRDLQFVQATVRVHLRQRRAIFDRFGRLILGSWETPRELVEFPVYECNATAEFHQWLLHGRYQSKDNRLPLLPTFRYYDQAA
uniref:39S ribosomal protein L39, mitochondrial n=1 Tax=Macrostomum lignano TaxID=282301 RepID=A0A1I8G4R5_9PLAT